MLVIRDEQIKVFDKIAEEKFLNDLVQTVRDNNGEQVAELDDEELKNLVKVGVERARSHGLTCEDPISIFVGWMFEFAPNFDEQSTIQDLLKDERFEPDDRIELIAEAASEKDWAETEDLYDEQAWEGGKIESTNFLKDSTT